MAGGGDWRAKTPEVHKLAEAVKQALLPKLENAADADKVLRASFTNPTGPLQWLALALGDAKLGDVDAAAPAVLEYKLPGKLVADGEVVVTAQLHPEKGANGTAQFLVALNRPDAKALQGQPMVTGAKAGKQMEQAYDDFRELFPAAMCHAQIVPVDEVVTMILYHREDQMLRRLMLSEAEAAELDRLWDELFYVSQEPLLRVVSHEQLYEFATQDRKDLLPPLEDARADASTSEWAFEEDRASSFGGGLDWPNALASTVGDADKQERVVRGLARSGVVA